MDFGVQRSFLQHVESLLEGLYSFMVLDACLHYSCFPLGVRGTQISFEFLGRYGGFQKKAAFGVVCQLVDGMLCTHEVVGSSPINSNSFHYQGDHFPESLVRHRVPSYPIHHGSLEDRILDQRQVGPGFSSFLELFGSKEITC